MLLSQTFLLLVTLIEAITSNAAFQVPVSLSQQNRNASPKKYVISHLDEKKHVDQDDVGGDLSEERIKEMIREEVLKIRKEEREEALKEMKDTVKEERQEDLTSFDQDKIDFKFNIVFLCFVVLPIWGVFIDDIATQFFWARRSM